MPRVPFFAVAMLAASPLLADDQGVPGFARERPKVESGEPIFAFSAT